MSAAVPAASQTSAGATPTSGGEDLGRAKRAASELEAVFIQQLLHAMRQASRPASGERASQSRTIYQDMMDEHLGRTLAQGGGIGLRDLIVRDLARRQQVQKNPSSSAARVPMDEQAQPAAQGDLP